VTTIASASPSRLGPGPSLLIPPPSSCLLIPPAADPFARFGGRASLSQRYASRLSRPGGARPIPPQGDIAARSGRPANRSLL
jgi:hypothetical protein